MWVVLWIYLSIYQSIPSFWANRVKNKDDPMFSFFNNALCTKWFSGFVGVYYSSINGARFILVPQFIIWDWSYFSLQCDRSLFHALWITLIRFYQIRVLCNVRLELEIKMPKWIMFGFSEKRIMNPLNLPLIFLPFSRLLLAFTCIQYIVYNIAYRFIFYQHNNGQQTIKIKWNHNIWRISDFLGRQ